MSNNLSVRGNINASNITLTGYLDGDVGDKNESDLTLQDNVYANQVHVAELIGPTSMVLTDLTVTNDATIQNNVQINNSLSVGDDIIVAGNLSVTRVFGHIGVQQQQQH